MSVTKQDVIKIARLSQLKIDDDKIEQVATRMSDILKFVDKLNELDLEGIEPTAHAVSVKNVFREDVVKPTEIIQKALEQAPESEEGFFSVPKVI